MTYKEILARLHELANPEKVAYKEKKFGVISKNALGIYNKDLSQLKKEIGMNSEMGLRLFDSEIYEAKLLCSKIFRPKDVTPELMEKWMVTFDNWEFTDSFCMGLFAKSQYAVPKIFEWAERTAEFEKRSSFATMAGYCSSDKKALNDVFESFFPLIEQASTDERNFIKKAVNWALRSIGKRNRDLQVKAIVTAEKLLKLDSKSAGWIARDAIRELQLENVRMSDYPRDIYRAE